MKLVVTMFVVSWCLFLTGIVCGVVVDLAGGFKGEKATPGKTLLGFFSLAGLICTGIAYFHWLALV